jgi:large subunit ribosomal protein L29
MREYHPNKIREMAADELVTKIRDLREELFNLRFRNSMRQLDNSLKVREARRDLARVITILTEHERGIRPLGAVKAAARAVASGEASETGAAKTPRAKKTTKKKAARTKKTGGPAKASRPSKVAKKATKAAKAPRAKKAPRAPKATSK